MLLALLLLLEYLVFRLVPEYPEVLEDLLHLEYLEYLVFRLVPEYPEVLADLEGQHLLVLIH